MSAGEDDGEMGSVGSSKESRHGVTGLAVRRWKVGTGRSQVGRNAAGCTREMYGGEERWKRYLMVEARGGARRVSLGYLVSMSIRSTGAVGTG